MRISGPKVLRLVVLALLVLATSLLLRQLLLSWVEVEPVTTQPQLLEKVSDQETVYVEPPIPKFWLTRDFTGLDEEELSESDEDRRGTASHLHYSFNAYKSNNISLRRQVPESRPRECLKQQYPAILPQASVIICFVDEVWSALFRTVWSVLDNSDPRFLKEIILVNDASEVDWLEEDLHLYMSKMPKIVRLLESPERLGLIRARTLGADHALGDVLVFLDSHCEAGKGWLEPILHRIGKNENTVVCPAIDVIHDRTLEYQIGNPLDTAVGTFHWTLDFAWTSPRRKQGARVTDPLDSPTMAGGLFAIHSSFWEKIGKYDLSMQGWGGENLEMSFRIWQCGGRLEILPCSHVGHIFRMTHPYKVPGGFGNAFMRNSARVAEVWLDEYKDVYYHIRPEAKKHDFGDVSERIALRTKLKCKSFKWFVDTLLPGKFVPFPEVMAFKGHLINVAFDQCVDLMGHYRQGESIGLYGCHSADTPSTNQAFYLTKAGQLRTTWDACIGYSTQSGDPKLVFPANLQECYSSDKWRYDQEALTLVFESKNLCLGASQTLPIVYVGPCIPHSPAQQWKWSGALNA